MALTPYKRAQFEQALMRKVASESGLRKVAISPLHAVYAARALARAMKGGGKAAQRAAQRAARGAGKAVKGELVPIGRREIIPYARGGSLVPFGRPGSGGLIPTAERLSGTWSAGARSAGGGGIPPFRNGPIIDAEIFEGAGGGLVPLSGGGGGLIPRGGSGALALTGGNAAKGAGRFGRAMQTAGKIGKGAVKYGTVPLAAGALGYKIGDTVGYGAGEKAGQAAGFGAGFDSARKADSAALEASIKKYAPWVGGGTLLALLAAYGLGRI